MRGRKPQADAVRRGLTDQLLIAEREGARYGVGIPEDIAADPIQSEIWAWVVPEVNHFTSQDIPQLRELVMWHAIFEQARQSVMYPDGSGRIAIFDKVGEKSYTDTDGKRPALYKKHPALSVMKEASAEIRALSDHLGLSPLARSRIGLFQTTAAKSAAETAAMFMEMERAYPEIDAAYAEAEVVEE